MRSYDEKKPQVCIDEGSTQLVGDLRDPLLMEPGKIRRVDYEFERNGYCSIFLACEPLTGKTVTSVQERRGSEDFAHFLKHLIDDIYPKAEKIVLVMDNLNTHVPGSLYKVFSIGRGDALVENLEIHYTPLHGNWLSMAEIELSVLGRQALSGRIKDLEALQERVTAWQAQRDAHPSRSIGVLLLKMLVSKSSNYIQCLKHRHLS